MRIRNYFVCTFILLLGCRPYKIKNIYFKSETIELNAKVDSIDSTDNHYIYFISNDTIKAYFSKPKICKSPLKFSLKLNKFYTLKVKTDANIMYRFKTHMGDDLYVEDRFFESEEPRLILDDCFNICGKTIENDEKNINN